MQKLGWLSVAMCALLTTGCNLCQQDLGPPKLVDVNEERGDEAGRNYYLYKAHELHPYHYRRYDYHPKRYHRFLYRDAWEN